MTLAVAPTTSAYSGAPTEIMGGLGGSREIYEFGFSVYVLGFALGPLIWGPLSEIYGRQFLFFTTLSLLTTCISIFRVIPYSFLKPSEHYM